jgi:hypothetical protein
MSLTVSASLNVFGDVYSHLRPPVQSFRELYCFADSWVSVNRGIVMGSNNMMLSFDIPCYYLPSILIPYSLVSLELVGVDPWFQHAFLLIRVIWEYFHCSREYLFW